MGLFILDDKWKARLEAMWAWQRNLRVTGDGVAFRNAESGASVSITQSTGSSSSKPPLFPVNLSTPSSNAGSNGNATSAPTYKYVVLDLNNNVLAGSDTTPVAPTQARPKGFTVRATHGLACYDATGALAIWWCDETPDTTGSCTT